MGVVLRVWAVFLLFLGLWCGFWGCDVGGGGVSLSGWQCVVGVFSGFLLVCLLGIFRIVSGLVVVGSGFVF